MLWTSEYIVTEIWRNSFINNLIIQKYHNEDELIEWFTNFYTGKPIWQREMHKYEPIEICTMVSFKFILLWVHLSVLQW